MLRSGPHDAGRAVHESSCCSRVIDRGTQMARSICPRPVLDCAGKAHDVYVRYNLRRYLLIWWAFRLLLVVVWYFWWYQGGSKLHPPATHPAPPVIENISRDVLAVGLPQVPQARTPSGPGEAAFNRDPSTDTDLTSHVKTQQDTVATVAQTKPIDDGGALHEPAVVTVPESMTTIVARCGWDPRGMTDHRDGRTTGTVCVFEGALAYQKPPTREDARAGHGESFYTIGVSKRLPLQFPADDTLEGMIKYHNFAGIPVRKGLVHGRPPELHPKRECGHIEQRPAIVFHSSSPNNLFHALVNNIIPLLSTVYAQSQDMGIVPATEDVSFEQINSTEVVRHLASSLSLWSIYQIDTQAPSRVWDGLQALALPRPIHGLRDLSAANPISSPQYDVCFLNRTIVGIGIPPTARLPWPTIKSYLLSHSGGIDPSAALSKGRKSRVPHIVFVIRSASTTSRGRVFLNEDALIQVLQKLASERYITYTTVDFSKLSFTTQLQVAVTSNILMGAHGAGLSWFMFAPEGSVLAQIVPWGTGDGELKYLYQHHAELNPNSRVLTYEVLPSADEHVECIQNVQNGRDQHNNHYDCKGTIWMNFALSPSRFELFIRQAVNAWKSQQNSILEQGRPKRKLQSRFP